MTFPTTGKLPGYREQGVVLPIDQMASQIFTHQGEDYLVVHAPALTTGVTRAAGTTGEDDRPVITIWAAPRPDSPVAMALSFSPNDDMLDCIISSLTTMRDRRAAAAADQARAALRRAGGK